MMPEFTKVTWSEPSRRERPMQGFWPHSVQKRYLGSRRAAQKNTPIVLCVLFLHTLPTGGKINTTVTTTAKKKKSEMRTKELRPTLSVDGRRWPEADPVLQIWPLSGTHHSDGKFRWDWNRGRSNTGFLVDGREGKKAITGWVNTSFIDPHEHQTCEG